jgi:hypothetical protein
MRPEPPGYTELLARKPEPVASLARRLRAAVLEALPDITERFYPGWQGLGLRDPVAGLVGTVFPHDGEVVVYLEHGAALPDPHGLLGGADRLRRTRTLTFRPEAQVPNESQLVEYLDLALEHARAHRDR